MTSYPAQFVDENGVVRLEGEVAFTGGVDAPLNATLPAVVNGAALPTADPHVAGELWNDAGAVKVSAG